MVSPLQRRKTDVAHLTSYIIFAQERTNNQFLMVTNETGRKRIRPQGLGPVLERLLNRNLPAGWHIELRGGWPLIFVPFLLIMQLVGPSAIWTALGVTLIVLYGISYMWVRSQVSHIGFERRREGAMLVVGDALQERFVVQNHSSLPLHWLEFADESRLPDYNPRQVVSCGAGSSYQWRAEARCNQRGVFRLGPHTLRTGDPFGLFCLEIQGRDTESLLVYPRVAHIPTLDLPRGNLSGQDHRRRPYSGTERAAVVRAYRSGDSLRYIHWPTSARRGELMVTDLETEPSGDLWVVLDVNRQVQTGDTTTSTLETGIILAASVAAEYLSGVERRAVGLLTAPANHLDPDETVLVDVPPLPGKGQVWRILAALAPLQTGGLPLSQLLQRSRGLLNAGQTVLVITSEIGEGVANWSAELLHLRRGGVAAGVLAVTPAPEPTQDHRGGDGLVRTLKDDHQSRMLDILTRYEIPVQFQQAGTRLTPALTYRRTRTVLRTTPTGGVVTHEIEEDVG